MIEADYETSGESQIYVGTGYLSEIASQIRNIRLAQRDAYRYRNEFILGWLTELRCFYDLIDNQLRIRNSNTKIDIKVYKLVGDELKRIDTEIEERYKYIFWFNEIEEMFRRRTNLINNAENMNTIRVKENEILLELSNCYRDIMFEANKRHLIMPDTKKDMKELAKQDWSDRDKVKKLYTK